MWPKNFIADLPGIRTGVPRLLLLLLLGLPPGLLLAQATSSVDHRGIPLEVEAGGEWPAVIAPPAGSSSSKREAIEALDLGLGPVPRRILLGEDAAGATWKQAAALPETSLALLLSQGNMIRSALLRRLASLSKIEIFFELPVLAVHRAQLTRLPSLAGITLGVDPGEDKAAREALSRFPPSRLRVLLRAPFEASRIAGWSESRRVQLVIPLGSEGLSPEVVAALSALGPQRLELQLSAEEVRASRHVIDVLYPGAVIVLVRGGLPSRSALEGLARPGRALRVRFLGELRPDHLRVLRGLPGLEVEIDLSGMKRRAARASLALMARSLGQRKPR